ncbi:agmatine deiminase family protein [Kitasatospora sp. NPDC094015]|uniref:agmatine deiminase family protein n=1 Tax=Kitasatospora sp. NPDC094015 TaxID=3155205 RepID=UPI003328432D
MNEQVAEENSAGRPEMPALGRRRVLAAAGLTAVGVVWAANSGTSQVARAADAPGCGTPSPTPSPTPTGGTGTFRVPIDTVRHTRTWMAWPDSTAIWGSGGGRGGTSLAGIQANIALIANTIAKYEPVVMCANPASAAAAKRACSAANVTVISTIPVDDCWMRDSGPVFRTNGAGGLDAIGLNFNGWGNKQTHAKDAQVARLVAAYAGVPFTAAAGFVAEGGAIEADGAGTLMATRSSILDPARNGSMNQAGAEAAMCAAYGASKVIWFDGYVDQGDITRDHVDATSRFLEVGKGLVQQPNAKDPKDGWNNDEINQYKVLSTATDAAGHPVAVTKVGGPDYNVIRSTSADFVGSYANYYVCNGAVISAQFGDAKADAAAKAVLQGLFPGRVIEQLNIDSVGAGGGGIHCVTQPQPAP